MSVYNLTCADRIIYNEIIGALDSHQLQVQLPRASAKEILSIYNKAISESRNGFLYKPGSVQTISSITKTTLYMEMCPEAKNRITFCSAIEFEAYDIICVAMKNYTDYDKVFSVYRYFVNKFRYAQSNSNSEKYHSTASPFLYREAVCEGFAFAFAYVVNRMGIPCGIVTGVSTLGDSGGSHAWNIICLENKYYHVDVTWDICTKEKGDYLFEYFLLDDSSILRNHRWSDSSIPPCVDSSVKYNGFSNYFNKGGRLQ